MPPRPHDFEQRLNAVRQNMRGERLSALVAYGASSYVGLATGSAGYIRYLTGWTGSCLPSMLVLPAAGPAILLVPGGLESLYAAETCPVAGQHVPEFPQNYGRLARQILLESRAERVGLLGQSEMPHPVYRDLVESGDSPAFVPAEHLVDTLRLTRDEAEVERHREASRVSDHMFGTLVEQLRGYRGPASTLMVEMEHAGRSKGAEIARCWMAIGQPADRQRFRLAELTREVREGDQVLVGTYVAYDGYWGHCLRMGAIGRPSDGFVRLYETVATAHQAGLARLRVGGDARQIVAEMERVAEELLPGSTDPSQPFRFRHAHFMGLDYAERPTALAFPQPARWSNASAPVAGQVTLRPGMVLELHPNIGLPGAGFAVLGDTYLLREEGPERLTGFPQELFVV